MQGVIMFRNKHPPTQGIWNAADEPELNTVHKKIISKFGFLFNMED